MGVSSLENISFMEMIEEATICKREPYKLTKHVL
jgi:hypothetical protein